MVIMLVGGLLVAAVGVWIYRAYHREVAEERGSLPDSVYRAVMISAYALIAVGGASLLLGMMWLMAITA